MDNNEGDTRIERPALRHRQLQKLVLLATLALLVGGTEGRGILDSKSKLDMIRSLSASSGVHSSPFLMKHGHGHDQGQGGLQDPEVCYDDGCLDAGNYFYFVTLLILISQ